MAGYFVALQFFYSYASLAVAIQMFPRVPSLLHSVAPRFADMFHTTAPPGFPIVV